MHGFGELHAKISMIAQRLGAIRTACSNEESTKLFLVLPVINALGYDTTDPSVVRPEFAADFRDGATDRVDFAIMQNGHPVIAIECKKAETDLSLHRGQLRAYFTALQSVRLGILTNGSCFEFFVDCENPNIMDPEPFATLDMDVAAQGPIPPETLETLAAISKSNFHPDFIAEIAEARLVSKRLRGVMLQELREPSEELCRLVLRRVGLENLRSYRIATHYSSLVRSAIEEALIIPVLEQLRKAEASPDDQAMPTDAPSQRIMTTERELAVYRYVCRRLAFLATDEYQFAAIEQVQFRDYVGKFAIYYENVRKGRIFDFIEGSNGYDKFIFPAPFGEILTNTIADIDKPLREMFALRVRETGPPSLMSTNPQTTMRA
jgi:hypothetical protein